LKNQRESCDKILNLVEAAFAGKPYRKFFVGFERKVDADGQASHYKMYVEDYVKYPRKLEGHSDSDNGDYSFAHRGQDKVSHVISDIRNTVFYMIDSK